MTHAILTVALLGFAAVPVAAQQVDPAVCPLHAAHTGAAAPRQHGDAPADARHAAMEARGTTTMGFDQTRASHHFSLAPRGGRIEIHANGKGDVATRQQIATHLQDIAARFGRGDFAIPFATHGGEPDGVAAMKRLEDQITYAFEPSPFGGRVTIATRNDEALAAVHAFLRYQIAEHRTGDPTTIAR